MLESFTVNASNAEDVMNSIGTIYSRAELNPVTSEIECLCPSTDTFEPPTVNALNEPEDFDTVVFVMPDTIPDRLVTSAMVCL